VQGLVQKSLDVDAVEQDMKVLAMPPRRFGEKFEETYDVILILDDRENFGSVCSPPCNTPPNPPKHRENIYRLHFLF